MPSRVDRMDGEADLLAGKHNVGIEVEPLEGSYWDREVTVTIEGSVATVLPLAMVVDRGLDALPDVVGLQVAAAVGRHFADEVAAGFDGDRLEADARGLVALHVDSLDELLSVTVDVDDGEDDR